jgi:hypothetical protein
MREYVVMQRSATNVGRHATIVVIGGKPTYQTGSHEYFNEDIQSTESRSSYDAFFEVVRSRSSGILPRGPGGACGGGNRSSRGRLLIVGLNYADHYNRLP